MVKGFDVSNLQPSINFADAYHRSGIRFGWSKVSEGAGFADHPWVTGRKSSMRKAGLRVGGYHFAHMGSVDAELHHFLSCLDAGGGRHAGDLPCAIDFEYEPNRLTKGENYRWLASFAEGVRRHTGRGCVLYGNGYYIDAHLSLIPPGCGVLWLAGYPTYKHPAAAARTSGAKVLFHQFTDRGEVAGSPGPNDVDHYFGRSVAAFCH